MADEDARQAKQDKMKKDAAQAKPKEDKKGLLAQAKENLEKKKEEAKPKNKKDITEKKVLLEREYVVPLRKEWLKVPEYKRANKAVKALKQFIAQHMKVYDRDLRKVKIDILLNNELRYRGMKKPAPKIKVRAIKNDDGTVDVKLVNIPKHIEFELARKARREAEVTKNIAEKKAAAPTAAEKPKEGKDKEKPTDAEEKETKEKETSSKEATQELEKAQAKQMQKTSSKKAPIIQRKAMQK